MLNRMVLHRKQNTLLLSYILKKYSNVNLLSLSLFLAKKCTVLNTVASFHACAQNTNHAYCKDREFQIEMNNLFTQFEFEKEKKKQHK